MVQETDKTNDDATPENANDEAGAIAIGKNIVVKKLAEKLDVPVTQLITVLIQNGFMVNMNQEIDFETAELIAPELGKRVVLDEKVDAVISSRLTGKHLKELSREAEGATVAKRAPIVTIMGHVDHGKTTLLDTIRDTNMAAGEAGLITQHIGAYQVVDKGRPITFLDTPGHEAFIEMRQKGADITDIAVLVVAANDGVQPTTIEAMNHAKAAGIPIIVAVNKIDLPDAKPEQVKKQLSEIGLQPEEWGGDTVFVEVSAKKKLGIQELLDTILLVADLQELKANADRKAIGYVIEAKMSPKGGPAATIIVKTGTLHNGDPVAVGDAFGNVRGITNFKGEQVSEAGPSMPVQIMGLSKVPLSGDVLEVVDSKMEAKDRAEKINREEKARRLRSKFESLEKSKEKKVFVIIKADVQGSVDAILQSIQPLSLDGFGVEVVQSGAGPITDTDVMMAATTGASIMGFNVIPSANAKKMAEREKVEIGEYKIIYDLIENVKAKIAKLAGPVRNRVELGKLKVLAIFRTTRNEMIIGGKVMKDIMKNKAKFEVMRNDEKIGDGEITQLQQNKKPADEVKSPNECGMQIRANVKVRVNDEIVAYEIEEKERVFK